MPQNFEANSDIYAHTKAGRPVSEWEPLDEHLRRVAEGFGDSVGLGAAHFARAFSAEAWGRAAGLWHDLGKYAPSFQRYLSQTAELADDDPHRAALRGTVDHSTAGALHAARTLGKLGRVLAYPILGHHAGLPNTQTEPGERSSLEVRLKHPPPEATDAIAAAPDWMTDAASLELPSLKWDKSDSRRAAFQLAFFVRMVFSSLVDADYLATEAFMDPQRASGRAGAEPSLEALQSRLETHLRELAKQVSSKGLADQPVNRWRRRVLEACREAAGDEPGFFSLNVPTGGGKTFSSLAFALGHATAHEMRRVIVAIPFTSIIEQNAQEYRAALGDLADQLIEHHSSLDPRRETERNRFAAENWDAPLVVTTNVQLLESLFAAKTSRCRKLHRLAHSVIVLDEAQALPPNLLKPTLWALQELVTNYGCTIVLCTATQPALEKPEDQPGVFDIGIEKPRPIIGEAERASLFEALMRVRVERAGTLNDVSLVDQLAGEEQVLCVVNTRGHARELFMALTEKLGETETELEEARDGPPAGSCLHLSANMCPSHRSDVLGVIRKRLERGEPCRVVSTQLVEAGVDLDFPVVYRAMAGLDAITQAAGRCNREGRLSEPGRVVVFEPDANERRLPGFVRAAINAADQVLAEHNDPLSPEAQHQYFRLFYWDEKNRSGWDRPPGAGQKDARVLDCFQKGGDLLQFREAEKRYRLISDDQEAIVIPYGDRGRKLVETLKTSPNPPDRVLSRLLQRFTVSVPKRKAEEMLNNQLFEPPDQTYDRLVLANPDAYDRRLGLRDDVSGWEPEGLIA